MFKLYSLLEKHNFLKLFFNFVTTCVYVVVVQVPTEAIRGPWITQDLELRAVVKNVIIISKKKICEEK